MGNLVVNINSNGYISCEITEGHGPLEVLTVTPLNESLVLQTPITIIETEEEPEVPIQELEEAAEEFHEEEIVTNELVVETEEEIVNQETILNYYETLNVSDREALRVALANDETIILARERAARRAARIAAGFTATGLTADQAGDSAWQIKQDFPDSIDGVYWIQNDDINNGEAFEIYADMTTLGGGWTLVLQNNYVNWDKDTALSFRPTTPPTTLVAEGTSGSDDSANYSIYGWADAIKRSATGFDYMIEAYARGRNGGAWTANQAYNFLDNATASTNWGTDIVSGSDGFHQDITEIELFPQGNSTDTGVWTYSDNGIEKRMPWYSDPSVYAPTQAIITTTHNDDNAWFGTLVANNTSWPPAPWIAGGNTSGSVSVDTARPNVIWMWVR